MRNGNVAPPSIERYSSSSHHDKSMLGRTVFHSTLTCCPGYRTCPNVGESSLAAYLGPSAFDRCDNGGANARATANRTTTEVGIFILLSFRKGTDFGTGRPIKRLYHDIFVI